MPPIVPYIVKVVDSEKEISLTSTENLLTAARRQGVAIPLGCRGGGCGMCKIRVIKGDYKIGPSSKKVLNEREREQNFILSCKTFVLSDLEIKL